MPACRTSAAREAPNVDRKLLLAAYMTVKGDTIAAAAEDVNTKQPLSCLVLCAAWTRSAGSGVAQARPGLPHPP